jgi:hypothetical protein
MAAPAPELAAKLNAIIALLLHFATKDSQFNDGKHSTGDLASFLKRNGLDYADIAAILDSPLRSIRELVNRQKRSSKKRK